MEKRLSTWEGRRLCSEIVRLVSGAVKSNLLNLLKYSGHHYDYFVSSLKAYRGVLENLQYALMDLDARNEGDKRTFSEILKTQKATARKAKQRSNARDQPEVRRMTERRWKALDVYVINQTRLSLLESN